MKRRHFAALAAAAARPRPTVLAQDRTIKILVGFPPGGSVDVIARLLAEKLRVSLDQNVIVDNKPGAGGRVGSTSSSAPRRTARRWSSRPAAPW